MFEDFKTACIANGFHRRGKAFFRIIGDGVLQVLKYDKSRVPYNPIILVGLFSLYGELDPLWLTSGGCIPRYWIYHLIYPYEPTTKHILRGPEMEEQMAVLMEHGFLWLDSITDQIALVDAICKLDVLMQGEISWNDMEKFAPFLKSSNFEGAQKVIQAHIDQYLTARERNLSSIYKASSERYLADMRMFEELLKMVQTRDLEKIRVFLTTNYANNIQSTAFCRN